MGRNRTLGLRRIAAVLIFLLHGTIKALHWPAPQPELLAMLTPQLVPAGR